MKKRILLALCSVVLATIVLATPAMAAWIGGIIQPAQINEPLIPTGLDSAPKQVVPGQQIVWLSEVKNTAENMTYGLQYFVTAYYDYYALGMSAAGASTDTAGASPLSETMSHEKLTLQESSMSSMSPMGGGSGGSGYSSIGQLTLYVDPDGLAGPQPETIFVPGNTINISPKGFHTLRLTLDVAYSAYPGTIVSYLDTNRGAPAVSQ